MTDLYSTPADEGGLENPVDFLRRRAQTLAASHAESDPEEAARALKLSDATGMPAGVVDANITEIDANLRQTISSEIVGKSDHLQDYINKHPLAAKVSNDDWANLSLLSDTLKRSEPNLADKIADTYKDTEDFLSRVQRATDPVTILGAAIRSGYEASELSQPPGAGWLKDVDIKDWPIASAVVSGTIGAAFETISRVFGIGVAGLKGGASEAYKQYTGDEQGGDRFGREVAAIAEWYLMRGDIRTGARGILHEPLPKEVGDFLTSVNPYVKSGKEPPVGIHPLIDEAKEAQAKIDAKNLDEALKLAKKTTTGERSAQALQEFIELRFNPEIGVSAEAIRKLYGDKVPVPDDGILGFIPQIDAQMKLAEMGGGDVSVPRSVWLAHVDPEVAKVLKDDIRVRQGGMTLNEIKLSKEVKAEELPPTLRAGDEAVDAVRKGASFEPMFDNARERKLELKRKEATELSNELREGQTLAFHDFDFVDPAGNNLGGVTVSVDAKNPTTLYVEMVSGGSEAGKERYTPNAFGPRVMRDVLAQLRQEFPEATHVAGYRVSGAREKAGDKFAEVRIKLDTPSDVDLQRFADHLDRMQGTELMEWSSSVVSHWKEFENYTPEEQKVILSVQDAIGRVAGKTVDAHPMAQITLKGKGEAEAGATLGQAARGVYIQYDEIKPIILWSVGSDHPEWTGRHEALHHLRAYNFFKPEEWATLERSARINNWKGKHDIDERYSGLGEAARREEAIADEFGEWASGKAAPSSAVAKVFEKIKAFLEGVRASLKEAFGGKLGWEEIFRKIESGEIAERGPGAPRTEGAKDVRADTGPAQPELPGMTRMEDREVFAAAAKYGISAERYKGYMKLIEQRDAELLKSQQAKAEAEAKRRLTSEWKANREKAKEEVEAGLSQRPEIAADEFLRTGKYLGDKLDKRYKINDEFMTPAQRVAIPEFMRSEDGIHPDDLAGMFGYKSGSEMIERLAELTSARDASGLSPGKFHDRLVKIETDKMMKKRYGDLEKNIIAEAKEHVLSPTQLDILSEDTLFLAEKAGLELPLTGAPLRRQLAIEFNNIPAKNISSDKFLAVSGRAGRAAEMALLKGDPKEAFRLAQGREHAAILAKEAERFEKEQVSAEKLYKRLREPVIKSVDQAYTNFAHALLSEAGYKVKLDPAHIVRDIEFQGYKDLDAFVSDKSTFGYDFDIEPGYRPKNHEAMTVGEAREFKDAIDSLYDNGRDEQKIVVAGEKIDFAEWKAGAIANLKERPVRDIEQAEKGGSWLYRLDAPFTRMEEIFKDFDMRKEMGPFWSALILPFEQSKARSFDMLQKLKGDLNSIPGFKKKWQKTLDDVLPNDFVWDVWNDTPFKMTRWNMIKMMLNWGNEGNAQKLVSGLARAKLKEGEKPTPGHLDMTRSRVEQLFADHATKEDWSYVQSVWDIFKGWQKDADTVSRNVSGKGMKMIEPREVVTQHGTFTGGYFPLIPDKLRKIGAGITERGQYTGDGPLGSDYFRATTNQSHFIERTKANYFVDISAGPEQLIGRMQQVIHDIAYRDFVVNAGKVLYDTEIKNAMEKHYGVEYQQQMVPWLKRIANQFTASERELQGWNDVLKRFRMNLLAAALPLNYSVMLSPSVGTANLKNFLSFNVDRKANQKMVLENSKELKHMLYNLDRDILEQMNRTLGTRGWTSYQLHAMETMFKPLMWMEQQARMNTFYGEFMDQKGKGRTDYEASALADSKIRERHGVAHVGDLPALMASKNEFVKLSTLFMGYFTSQRNWLRQVPEQARQGDISGMAKTLWGTVAVAALFNAALFTRPRRDESLFHFLGRSVMSVPMQMIPFVRDIWSYYSEGYKTSSPLTSLAVSVGQLGKDGWNITQGKRSKDPVKHAFDVLGTGVGLPGATQIGRTLDFLNDVQRGEQRPRDLTEWMRGAATGESLLRKR